MVSNMGMRALAIRRIRILTSAIIALALLLIARCYYLQINQHSVYVEKATRQYVHTVRDIYDRGSIFFTTKEGELVSGAAIESGYVLAADPTAVEDAQTECEQLAQHLTLDIELCVARATKPDRTYVELDSTVPEEVAQNIDTKTLPGVSLYRTQWRYYPGDTVAARTVGFTSYLDGSTQPVGSYGLERSYDNILSRDPNRLSVNFFAEIFANLTAPEEEVSESNKPGSVVTTIEPTVARMLQNELQTAQDKWQSNLTGGIIMDPKTGAIYAMDVVPAFNLNDRKDVPIEDFRNPLVENVYEMGSIIKPLTMASGLDAGAVTPSTTYDDPGCLELDGFRVCNYDHRARGVVPMQEVLNQSLNTGVSFVVRTMGKDKFRDYFTKLQLGSETGIDLPNEAHGLVQNLQSPRDVEYATASFGQGIAMTPVETVRALATLGNGGYLVTPHMASKVVYDDGTEKEISYPQGEQIFSAQTSETISRMLTTVVDKALRNGTVKLPDYSVAAKTGTAQIADPQGGYYDDRYLHSFFGYFPSYDPKFIVFLYTVEPKGVQYASETLTETFMDITKFLINYYAIPPDR